MDLIKTHRSLRRYFISDLADEIISCLYEPINEIEAERNLLQRSLLIAISDQSSYEGSEMTVNSILRDNEAADREKIKIGRFLIDQSNKRSVVEGIGRYPEDVPDSVKIELFKYYLETLTPYEWKREIDLISDIIGGVEVIDKEPLLKLLKSGFMNEYKYKIEGYQLYLDRIVSGLKGL